MSDLLSQEKFITDAQFDIEYYAKRVVECKIDFDFTGKSFDKARLDNCLQELAKAENRLKVFIEKFGVKESEKPPIVKWALTN